MAQLNEGKKVMYCVNIKYYGIVQGIGFRAHIKRKAMDYSLTGWVKNLPDGSVEAIFCGDERSIGIVINYSLRIPGSRIERYEKKAIAECDFYDFVIR